MLGGWLIAQRGLDRVFCFKDRVQRQELARHLLEQLLRSPPRPGVGHHLELAQRGGHVLRAGCRAGLSHRRRRRHRDVEQALYRLGVSDETATLIATLSPAQIMKIASGNTLLCAFRMSDDLVWGLLTSHAKPGASDSVNRLHASILMAGRHQEAA